MCMRIVSLVPHATELLFALGLGPQLVAVTHECDYPPAALGLERVTRDVLPAGLSASEIDAAVRERTLAGEAIYELDRKALVALAPDLIVTQALCPVCAVSYDEVAALARELPSQPQVIALDPKTLGESLGDVRTGAEATGTREQGVALVHWTPQLIELAGGADALGLAGEPSQVVTWDAVAAAGPEVVVVMPCGYDAERAHTEASAYARELAGLRARALVAVNASAYFSRPGPRLIDGIELLAHILHPGRSPTAPEQPLQVDLSDVLSRGGAH
jgi:iron complex transport system substrate-binding protein